MIDETMDDYGIPGHLREGILAYVDQHRPTGDFLRCVISNDLSGAAVRADHQSRYALVGIVLWFRDATPMVCWGSREKCNAWVKR